MLNFGFHFGANEPVVSCDSPAGERMRNYSFSCDGLYWTTANASATYPDDNCIVTRNGSAGRVQQLVFLQAGDYTIEVEVIDVSSTAFVLLNAPDSGSDFPIDYANAGTHTTTITAATDGMYTVGCGVNNPIGSTGTFGYLSVRAVVPLTYNGEVITYDGQVLTY